MADRKLTPDEIAGNLIITGNLKLWLKNKRLTQEQVANKMDVSKATISKWLRGLQAMNGKQLVTIAKIIDVSPQQLILPPGHLPAAPEFEAAARLLKKLSPEDLRRWLDFGEGLSMTKD